MNSTRMESQLKSAARLCVRNIETNTTPSVIHANGTSKKEGTPCYGTWPAILESLRSASAGFDKSPLRDDLTLITWKGGYCANQRTALEMSCEHFGVGLTILPWPSDVPDPWDALRAKHYKTLEAIESGRIRTTFMMALDAADVVLLKHPNRIFEDALREYGRYKSVWSAETNDWPNRHLPRYASHPILDDFLEKIGEADRKRMDVHGSRFAFMNTGCVIGQTESLAHFYSLGLRICSGMKTNDQAMGRIAQFLQPDEHTVDYACRIFQCLQDVGLESLDLQVSS